LDVTKVLLFVAFVAVLAAAVFGLRAYQNRPRPYVPIDQKVFSSEVALLRDGTPIFAPNGTVGRALVDWLKTNDGKPRFFEVGGTQFVGRSVTPTPEAKGRLTRLVMMLRAYPDVRVRVVGFTDASGDPRADLDLSERRAQWVFDALADAGIPRRLLSHEGRGGAQPLAGTGAADHHQADERVGFLLDPVRRDAS
jgi:outer membrane protein OmpA-like peptidoglycan-associated protein